MVNIKQTYTLVDPSTEAIVPEFQGAPRIETVAGAAIGLIDDSKRNADVLLEEIANVLTEKYEVKSISWLKKPSASKPADPKELESLANNSDAIIIAIGD
tara:strand:+ start:13968 stop:14267 length:300 start_codon:yes stop_codon:yes gene_type:complete